MRVSRRWRGGNKLRTMLDNFWVRSVEIRISRQKGGQWAVYEMM
jgi:hypothetical protein